MRKPLLIVFLVDTVLIGLSLILMPSPLRPWLLHFGGSIFWMLIIANAALYYIFSKQEGNLKAIISFILALATMFITVYVLGVLKEFDKDYYDTRYFEKYDRKYALVIYTNCEYFFITNITSSREYEVLFDHYTKHNYTIYLGNNSAKIIHQKILIGFPYPKDTSTLIQSSLEKFLDVKDSIVLER